MTVGERIKEARKKAKMTVQSAYKTRLILSEIVKMIVDFLTNLNIIILKILNFPKEIINF